MDALNARLTVVQTALTGLTRPVGVISLIILFLAIIATPLLPEWGRENRGLLIKVLLCVAAVAWAPDIISFAMGS